MTERINLNALPDGWEWVYKQFSMKDYLAQSRGEYPEVKAIEDTDIIILGRGILRPPKT